MNTVRSFWLGWGSLCVAGAGAYYFAKQSIRVDRQAKLEAHRKQKEAQYSLEYGTTSTKMDVGERDGGPTRTGNAGLPSQEASSDPAPPRHAPTMESQRIIEKSKYEGSVPYRSPKGDRFS